METVRVSLPPIKVKTQTKERKQGRAFQHRSALHTHTIAVGDDTQEPLHATRDNVVQVQSPPNHVLMIEPFVRRHEELSQLQASLVSTMIEVCVL